VALVCVCPRNRGGEMLARRRTWVSNEDGSVGSVIKKRRKRMAKKKHRKLLRKTRVQRRNKK
jgi:Mitochondrial mRNA-processing protein COX24, C-terminal